MIRAFLVILLFVSSTTLQAAKLFIEGGLHVGGDELATVFFVGGGSESVKAGELLSASIGFISDLGESAEIRTSFGFKFDGVFAENGEVEFTRFPLELMAFTKGETFSFGAGISYHLAPDFSVDGPFIGGTTEFDDAVGFVVEIDYKLSERGYLGLKGTFIDYETSIALITTEVSGNSIGIVLGARFK